jgi:hypothetical protein
MSMLVLSGLLAVSSGRAQQAKPPPVRYSIQADLDNYPQAEAKAALASALKAIDKKKIDYLLAQLSDPQWVDNRVQKVHGGKFEELVKETTMKLAKDPTDIEELRRFLREGTWDVNDSEARVTLKDVPKDQVILRRIEGRWYLDSQKERDKGK